MLEEYDVSTRKESNTVILARIDERLRNLIVKVEDLCKHVNHEIEILYTRIKFLEEENLKRKVADEAARKERRIIKIFMGSITGLLAFIFTLLGVLAYLKII